MSTTIVRSPAGVGAVAICLLLANLLGPRLATAGAEFGRCVEQITERAIADGLPAARVRELTAGAAALPRVVELDRHQPESRLEFETYRERMLGGGRVERGRAALREYGESIRAASGKYGVEAELLVALWGLETDYGRVLGEFDSLNSLLTLACDPRRPEFFRGQALDLLSLLVESRLPQRRPRGSWAGAMGQLQFLPGLLRRHGIDLDRDGKVEIFRPDPELFATAARFLRHAGWQAGRPWGLEVDPAATDCPRRCNYAVASRPPALRAPNGRPLRLAPPFTLVRFDGSPPRVFALTANAEAILRWNRADFYAVAVGLLFDRLGEAGADQPPGG